VKPRKHRSRPRSPKIRKLWDRLASLGFRKVTLWWEPIGPALEMCGHSGGYMADIDGYMVPLGLDLKSAIRGVDQYADYVAAMERGR
jgi:hypothetical protein